MKKNTKNTNRTARDISTVDGLVDFLTNDLNADILSHDAFHEKYEGVSEARPKYVAKLLSAEFEDTGVYIPLVYDTSDSTVSTHAVIGATDYCDVILPTYPSPNLPPNDFLRFFFRYAQGRLQRPGVSLFQFGKEKYFGSNSLSNRSALVTSVDSEQKCEYVLSLSLQYFSFFPLGGNAGFRKYFKKHV